MKRKVVKAKPAKAPRQGVGWTPSSMVTIGLVVFGAFVIGPQLSDLITMQTQIAQLNANIAKSKEQLENIKEEAANSSKKHEAALKEQLERLGIN